MNENEEDKKRELTGLVIDCREIVIKKKQYDGLKLCVSESVNLIWEWHKKEIAKLKADNLRLGEACKTMLFENEKLNHAKKWGNTPGMIKAYEALKDTTDHTEKGDKE